MSTETLHQEIQVLKEMIENLSAQQKEYLNIKEAAKYLSVSESTLYKISSSRKIVFYKPNGKIILFKKTDLDLFIEQGRKKSYQELSDSVKSNSKFQY